MNEMTTEDLNRHAEALKLVNAEVTASLAAQFDASAKIDTKAAIPGPG